MPTRFVCLANSFKEGGRCLAGIELDNNNNAVIENGHPKWIRPVCNTPHGEIHTHLVVHLNMLDIIEIDVTGYPEEKNHQSENVFFNENSIRAVGTFSPDHLNQLCDKRNLVFGNKGKAVSAEGIENLSYSLMLINTDQFEVTEITYNDNPDKPRLRMVFSYNAIPYDFPITDPFFIYKYQRKHDIMKAAGLIYLCLSLGVAFNHWHYKLVAGVILK